MILLVAVFSLHHHTTHHSVGFFLASLCGVFVFRLAFRAFSSSSSSFVPPLTQLHPSSLTQRTQLISHNSSPLTTYVTHLTQLISHNSTQSRAAFVWHLVELLSCPLIELHPSSFTQLISQLTQLISHTSSHLTTHTTHLTQELL